MALQGAYKQFLAAPNPSFLADDASLHYITTLTTLNGPEDIIKHLNRQSYELKKKEEKFLDAVEGPDALAVEVHTTIEFVTGGGAYLPGLDDNFLADRTVNFPIIHIVSFNADGKIQQIRQNWDQGSLLKLIDVIGRTGRNWPIRDGKDQIKLITSSVKSTGKASSEPEKGDERDIARSRQNSNNVTRDPHASLSLFAPREKHEGTDSLPAVMPTRVSAKPPPRDYNELFVGNDSDNSPASKAKASDRPSSPTKSASAKAGAGKNYGPSRLFDNDDNSAPSPAKDLAADQFKKMNAKRYQHFDFADGSDPQDASRPTTLKEVNTKHGSQWGFDDFNTPAKVVPSKTLRTNEVRHWGNSDDEVMDSPIKFKKIDKPRKDAETHFEFVDDGGPDEHRPVGRNRGGNANAGMGLYKDDLFEGDNTSNVKPSETSIADVKARRKDFDSQFTMADEYSPAAKQTHISDDRAKAIKMMDSSWDTYGQSPNQKENVPASPSATRPTSKGPLSEATNQASNRVDQSKGINIAGDGMGGKKGLDSGDLQQRGIATGGDGMGGKKGVSRQWGFGDESDGEEVSGRSVTGKYKTGKTQGKPQATGGDFWDF